MALKRKPPHPKPVPVPRKESLVKWFFGHIFSMIRRHGSVFAFWGGIGYCVPEASLAVQSYAGHVSVADFSLRMLGSFSVFWSMNVTVSGLSISLYLKERREHRATRERLAEEKEKLERLLDPGRTSSLLTSDGQTRKGDE